MRRSSVIILAVVVLLATAVMGLLLYASLSYTTTGDVEKSDAVVPATLPSPNAQPVAEPDSAMVRLVFILSILVVFVSAVLVLFRLLGKLPFKD